MNDKQQQLTFHEGITNVPSDAICSDNTLEEEMGMYYADGEHHPIQDPETYMDLRESGLTVLFVHKLAGVTNYICIDQSGNVKAGFRNNNQLLSLYNGTLLENVDAGSIQITAIGKTLIVNTEDGIKYFLWKADNSEYYPFDRLPEPNVNFLLGTLRNNNPFWYRRSSMEIGEGWLTTYTSDGVKFVRIEEGHEAEYNDAAVGLYRENLKKISNDKGFARPFMVRYALEMYDGSYTMISAPILMLPSITHNSYGHLRNAGQKLTISTIELGLYYSANYDYSEWSDIVKGVVVFASDGVEVQDVTGHEEGSLRTFDRNVDKLPSIFGMEYRKISAATVYGDWSDPAADFWSFTKRDADSIADSIKTISIFYKIFELGLSQNTEGVHKQTTNLIKDDVITNLTSQERLTDDYYSHTKMSANFVSAYNNRLLLAGIKRGFFEGFTSFIPYNKNESHSVSERTLVIQVYIRTDEGTRIVSNRFETSDFIGKYFFYPDPRAYMARIYKVQRTTMDTYTLFKEIELEEHPYLNGAYYFEGLPDGTESMDGGTSLVFPAEDVTTPENLYNQIFNSEVNNPFVFTAKGNVTVGTGKVMALTTLTQALSQGQFGQYPIIVFTDEGVVAASINGEGVISATHPMSREVLNNVKSVTQTDGAVFFSSEKGLMVVIGNEVKCVSEQLSGRAQQGETPFQTFLKTAFIAYDYRDSLLWIFNGESSTCWIYSIKSGTFSRNRILNDGIVTNVVNKYPDYLLQIGTFMYSLIERENINVGTDEVTGHYDLYNCQIITRPMKLENGLALKSIRQIRNINQFVRDSYTQRFIDDPVIVQKLQLRIFASNDLKNWTELHSLRGTPWKYYKFQYDFKRLHATDRFAGAIVITQERRTNKMR